MTPTKDEVARIAETPRAAIARVDREIDDLRRLEPASHARANKERALFRERGMAQLARDQANERARAAYSMPKTKKCPTCGGSTFA